MKNASNRTLYKAAVKAAQRADDRIPHLDDREERAGALKAAAEAWEAAAALTDREAEKAFHLEQAAHRTHQIRTLRRVYDVGSISEQSRAHALARRSYVARLGSNS